MSDTSSTPDAPQGTEGEQSSTDKTPTAEELQAQVEELKKHSRKWEDRAKENYEARKELEQLREASLSDEEKRTKAIEETERRATEAEKRAEAAEAALNRYRIASEFSISPDDADLFLTASDEETLRKQAERLSESRSSGPRPNRAQGNRGSTGPQSKADVLGDFLDANF